MAAITETHLKGARFRFEYLIGRYLGVLTGLAAFLASSVVVAVAREFFPGGIPRYLDFACGTGRITQHLAPLAHESSSTMAATDVASAGGLSAAGSSHQVAGPMPFARATVI